MSLGAALLQPQRIRRAAQADPRATLADDLLRLIARLLRDQDQGGRVLEAVQGAFDALAGRLDAQARGGLGAARQRLGSALQPFLARLQATAPPAGAAEGLDLIRRGLESVADWAENLTLGELRDQVGLVLGVLQDDLGIDGAFLEAELAAFIDDLIAALDALPAEAEVELRENRRQTAALLRRLRRQALGGLALPRVEVEPIARAILSAVRKSGLARIARQAACIAGGAGAGAEVLELVQRLVPFPGLGPVSPSVGAAGLCDEDDRYCYSWYASWLLGTKDRTGYNILAALPLPWMPDFGDDIWIDRDTGKAMRTCPFFAGEEELLQVGGDQPYPGSFQTWEDIPAFDGRFALDGAGPYYTFEVAEPDTMEKWAFHTAWIADTLVLILHLASLEKGDWLSNTLHSTEITFRGIFKLGARAPFDWWLPVVAGPDLRGLWWFLSRLPLSTVIGTLQGRHSEARFGPSLAYWAWLLLGDGLENYIIRYGSRLVRDFFLSLLTLLNNDPGKSAGPDRRSPENRTEIDGVANLVSFLFGLVLPDLIDKKDYSHPGQNGDHRLKLLLLNLLAAPGMSVLSGFVAVIVATIIARDTDLETPGIYLGVSAITAWFTFWPGLYFGFEGNTDEGKFNPNGPAFSGYPERGSSPYRLPYASGKVVECAQGNQGLWSHNDVSPSTNRAGFTPQIYAYDFATDQGDLVLAARSGTVVDWFDWVPDDTNPDQSVPVDPADAAVIRAGQTTSQFWNFIVLRHDLDDAGNLSGGNPVAPDPDHDRDQGGAVVTTYGVYGHGLNGSVRAIFGLKGVAPADIIGQRVKRGEAIMQTGNTGVSAFNHIHIDVRPGPAAPSPAPAPAATVPVAFGSLVDRTIPFVFREAGSRFELHRIGGDSAEGVPVSRNWYASENTPVP